MKTEFKFSNLLGTVYSQGNLLFSPDGTLLYSPVGNRVTVFDLVNNESHTLPFAHRKNIARLGLTPRGNLLLSIDQDGRAILTHVQRRIILYHFTFKSRVSSLAFSPSGRHFAVGFDRHIEVWHTPSTPDQSAEGELDFAPFVLHRRYAGHSDAVTSVEWSGDSRFFLSSSKDLTSRIWSLESEDKSVKTVLGGHREVVLGAYFAKNQETIYTISKDGALFEWKYLPSRNAPEPSNDEDVDNDLHARWRITKKHFFLQQNAKVTCAVFHAERNLLVAGFSNGIFGLYEMPEFNMVHSLSISQNDIDFVTINKSGEWLAFGASKLGQLLVWEWQSENQILKQQGHFDSMNALVYSPDGQKIVTAADDGKVKIWDVKSGFSIATFTEHISGVTACEFAKNGSVLFTASLDGSVRAWDLVRYRNFKTFTAPTRLSFSCLAVDPSGDVVCAGSLDSFDIHVWDVRTGQLLDRLSGHEGPVSTLAFAPNGGVVVSGSWDHTVRIWELFNRTQTSEPLQLQADVLDVAFRPDSLQLAVSTLDGQLTFWSVSEAQQQSGVDGRRDVSGGRKITDRRTAANAAGTKSFSSIKYSADGECILAGGNSKYICLYSVDALVLLKKFTISINLSLSGTQEFLNSKLMTEAGPLGLIDEQGEASDLEDRIDRTLPGSTRGGDPSVRKRMPEIRVTDVDFSPAGRSFCAASTEGLLIYSLDMAPMFDPIDLDIDVTPASTLSTLKHEKDYLKALVMAFRLNEPSLLRQVFESIPPKDIVFVAKELPVVYLQRLLRLIGRQLEDSPHIQFCLAWIEASFDAHGRWIRDNKGLLDAELRVLERSIRKSQQECIRLAEENNYTVAFTSSQPLAKEAEGQLVILNGDAEMADSGDDVGWIGLD
ncbi:Periodic tryptophan protein 2 [Diplocarpon rosae]|nr:Periodic tryptophan protein 2 [Diplocarpon rosae]